MEAKVVVITGASSGIGAALARRLGEAGHSLALGARRLDRLEEIAEPFGDRAISVQTDVTRRVHVERLRDRSIDAFGHVDAWINNAGRGICREPLQLTDADVDDMMAVNFRSVLYGIQAIVPHFIERGGGHVVNVSSFLGRVPLVTFRSAYNAAKAAVNALTANVRMELATEHPEIRVSLVMPGVVATQFHREALGAPEGASVPSVGGAAQSADEVAEKIVALIAHPVAEIYTNPASAGLARRYYEDVGAFEQNASRRTGRVAERHTGGRSPADVRRR